MKCDISRHWHYRVPTATWFDGLSAGQQNGVAAKGFLCPFSGASPVSAEIIYGIDFRAKRRQSELEQLATVIFGEITVFGFDGSIDDGLVPVDTAPSEYWPMPDGAA